MYCETCKFSCKKKGDWSRHLQTKKHIRSVSEISELRTLLLDQQEQLRKLKETPPIQVTQKLNINIFLQENCQHAMNWDDFISTLQIQPHGIIPSICDQLNELGVYKRPIHCLNVKQKKMCLKNKNEWEHDDNKIQSAFTETTHRLIHSWIENNPSWHTQEKDVEMYTQLFTTNLNDISTAIVLH
jgi:hypothetical protein